MTDSPFLNEYILKGKQEGKQEGRWESRREDVARVLHKRFPDQAMETVLTRVDQETNLTLLQNWLDLAYEAPTWQAFRTKFNRLRRAKAVLPQAGQTAPC